MWRWCVAKWESESEFKKMDPSPEYVDADEILRIYEIADKCRQVDTDDGFPEDLLKVYRAVIAKYRLKEKFHHAGEQMTALANRLRSEYNRNRNLIIPNGR
jgi:hypothetical protein